MRMGWRRTGRSTQVFSGAWERGLRLMIQCEGENMTVTYVPGRNAV